MNRFFEEYQVFFCELSSRSRGFYRFPWVLEMIGTEIFVARSKNLPFTGLWYSTYKIGGRSRGLFFYKAGNEKMETWKLLIYPIFTFFRPFLWSSSISITSFFLFALITSQSLLFFNFSGLYSQSLWCFFKW